MCAPPAGALAPAKAALAARTDTLSVPSGDAACFCAPREPPCGAFARPGPPPRTTPARTWPCGGGRTPQHGRGSHVPASARPCPRRPRGMCALFSRSSVPATRCRRPGARPSTEGGRHNSHAARRSIWLALWRAASGAPRLGRARRAAGRQRTHRTSLGRARCLRPARSLLARRAQPLAGTVRLCASNSIGSKRPLRQVGVHPRGQRSWRGHGRVGAAKAAQLGRGHARATLYMTPRAAAGPYAPQSSFFFKPNLFFFWSASFGGPISLPQPLCTFLVARLGVVRQRPPGGERRKGGGLTLTVFGPGVCGARRALDGAPAMSGPRPSSVHAAVRAAYTAPRPATSGSTASAQAGGTSHAEYAAYAFRPDVQMLLSHMVQVRARQWAGGGGRGANLQHTAGWHAGSQAAAWLSCECAGGPVSAAAKRWGGRAMRRPGARPRGAGGGGPVFV